MFIVTYPTLKYIAPLGAKLGRVTFVGTLTALAAPTELRIKDGAAKL
jgi:RPA family protein